MGENELISHLCIAGIHILGGFFLYKLAELYFSDYKKVASIIVILYILNPFVFLINKWIYMDGPLMDFSIMSVYFLTVFLEKGKKYNFILFLITAIICITMKEYGVYMLMVYCFVVDTKFSLLANFIKWINQDKRKKWIFITALAILLLGVVSLQDVITNLFSQSFVFSTAQDAEYTLLLLDKKIQNERLGLIYTLCGQGLALLAVSGLLFITVLGMLRIKTEKGKIATVGIATLFNIIVLLQIKWERFHYSLYNIVDDPKKIVIIIIAGIVFAYLIFALIRKVDWLRLYKNRVLIIWAILPILIFSFGIGKLNQQDGHYTTMIDWRYIVISIPALTLLVGELLCQMLRSKGRYLNISLSVLLSTIIGSNVIILGNLYGYFDGWMVSQGEAYEYVKQQEPQTVYTGWPYCLDLNNMDIGQYSWQSDRIKIEDIYSADKETLQTEGILALINTGVGNPLANKNINEQMEYKRRAWFVDPIRLNILETYTPAIKIY